MVIKEGITQTEAAERVGLTNNASVSRMIAKIMTEKSHCDKQVIIPDRIAGNRNSEADFRKLSVAGQQAVRDGQPLKRVALDPLFVISLFR